MLLPCISRTGVVGVLGSIGNGGVVGMNGIFCRVSGLVQQEHPADGARRAAAYAGVMCLSYVITIIVYFFIAALEIMGIHPK